jgi:hypothetical protein
MMDVGGLPRALLVSIDCLSAVFGRFRCYLENRHNRTVARRKAVEQVIERINYISVIWVINKVKQPATRNSSKLTVIKLNGLSWFFHQLKSLYHYLPPIR